MAPVRRHVGLLLRVALGVLLLGAALRAGRLGAQSVPAAGPPNGVPDPRQNVIPLPASAPAAPDAPNERVVDIRIIGNSTISREKVLANISTRIDRPLEQTVFEKDIRNLKAKKWFVEGVYD